MQVLARLVPGLDTTQRLTKNLIVDESIRELEQQQIRYIVAMQNIQNLTAENERLNVEVANLRSQSVNVCACLRNAGIFAEMRPQTMYLHTGIENNWLWEASSMYGPTQTADASIVRTSVQNHPWPDVGEQSLQSCIPIHSMQRGLDVQDYQASPTNTSVLYPGMYVSDSCLGEDCLFRSPQSICPSDGSRGPCL